MKKLLILIFFSPLLFSLDKIQLNVIKEVYNTCKQYKASDGFSFENTCAAIVLSESSAGKHLIGDQGKHLEILVNSSLGAMQIRVKTVLYVFKKFPELRQQYNVFWHEDINSIDKYVPILATMNYYKIKWNQAVERRNKEKIRKYKKLYLKYKYKFKKYKKAYYKDLRIAETLLSDIRFSAKVAAHYLILNYEIAKKRRYWNPWLKAISRYNGGWDNRKYIRRVINRMKLVRKLKRKDYLK